MTGISTLRPGDPPKDATKETKKRARRKPNRKPNKEATKKTTNEQENLLLADLKLWEILEPSAERNGARELHRSYQFKTFEAAFKFMSAAATGIVSAQDHHPRWENTYNRVEVWLSTFELGNQISNKDLKLARSLEQLWQDFGKDV